MSTVSKLLSFLMLKNWEILWLVFCSLLLPHNTIYFKWPHLLTSIIFINVSKLMNTEYFSEYRSLISKTKYKNDSVKKLSTQEFLEILFLEILSWIFSFHECIKNSKCHYGEVLWLIEKEKRELFIFSIKEVISRSLRISYTS